MTTEHIVVGILLCIVFVIPTLAFIMDDQQWDRKQKDAPPPR